MTGRYKSEPLWKKWPEIVGAQLLGQAWVFSRIWYVHVCLVCVHALLQAFSGLLVKFVFELKSQCKICYPLIKQLILMFMGIVSSVSLNAWKMATCAATENCYTEMLFISACRNVILASVLAKSSRYHGMRCYYCSGCVIMWPSSPCPCCNFWKSWL